MNKEVVLWSNSRQAAVDPPAGHCDCTGVFDKRGYFLSDTGNFIGCGNLCALSYDGVVMVAAKTVETAFSTMGATGRLGVQV